MIRICIGAAFLSIVLLWWATDTSAEWDEGLVFYLTFNKVTGQSVVDESGNGFGAEIHENTKIVQGRYGDAIRVMVEGLNCVNIPPQEGLKINGAITMMAWIYYPEAWVGKKVHWIDKDCHGANRPRCFGIGSFDIGNGPLIYLFLGAWDRREELVVPNQMSQKKWHHVAGTYDGSTMKIYLDGKVIGQRDQKFRFASIDNLIVRIGCASARKQFAFVKGSIDEVAVWQRALSTDEINQAMEGKFLAVSPKNKMAATWADIKRRAVSP